MMLRARRADFLVLIASVCLATPVLARGACLAPQPVCGARASVFQIKSFNPYGSAVRIGFDLLVTSRHIVANETRVTVFTDT
ncbi:MAG: hypothetical protein ACR2OX_08290, partial [Methyloligellaceae bacterium]